MPGMNARVELESVTQITKAKMIRTVGIISRPRREDIARVVPPLIEWLRNHGVQVVCDAETAGQLCHRVDGKRAGGWLQFHQRWNEIVNLLGGQANHGIPVMQRQQILNRFVRWNRRPDKMNP